MGRQIVYKVVLWVAYYRSLRTTDLEYLLEFGLEDQMQHYVSQIRSTVQHRFIGLKI